MIGLWRKLGQILEEGRAGLMELGWYSDYHLVAAAIHGTSIGMLGKKLGTLRSWHVPSTPQ